MAGTMSSPPDLRKLQNHNVGDAKDMISDLPRDILHYILSLLPIKDALRTSILATKWRYLCTNLSVFHFETGPVMSNDSTSADYLLDQVDRLLHKSNRVERLCIITQCFVTVGKVSTFISSVVKHKVQDLKISLENLEGRFVFPNRFIASHTLNKLHLEFSCTLHIPSGICFPGLKTLVLSNVKFTNEKSVERLFSGCPVLQELTLYNCIWTNTRYIQFAIPTLRKLTICSHHCFLDYNESDKCTITIDVVNLLSLCCTSNPEVEFFLVKPTSVVDACIDLGCFDLDKQYSGECAFELLSGLSSVESLTLSKDFLQCLYHSKDTLHHLPSFHNLTHLYVLLRDNTLTGIVMDILLKTPNLEVLHFHAGLDTLKDLEDWTLFSVPCCFKYSLKSFCVSDFRGFEQHIQFIKFVLKNVRVLEEVRIVRSEKISTDLDNVRSQLQAVVPKNCLMTFP